MEKHYAQKLLIIEGSSSQTLSFNSENMWFYLNIVILIPIQSPLPPRYSDECNKLNRIHYISKTFQVWKQKLKFTVCFSPHWIFGWVLIIHLIICQFFNALGITLLFYSMHYTVKWSSVVIKLNSSETTKEVNYIRLLWYSKTNVSVAYYGVHTNFEKDLISLYCSM